MSLIKKAILLLTILIFVVSCSSDDPESPLGNYENGYFITNEGPFSNGTGTLTFIGNDGAVAQNVYQTVNNEVLGNIVQSMTFHNNNAYIVVNNSHKIVVADRYTMKKIAVIEGSNINNPRYFVAVGNYGYVSNWGSASNPSDDFIAVIDLNTNTVTSTISVGEGPEEMLVHNNNVYVNLQGGFSQNNKVAVINTNTNALSNTITVGDVPSAIEKDNSGAIWVLCSGNPNYSGNETNGKLIKIENNNITTTIDFGAQKHPNHLTINENNLYYNLDGKVYTMNNTQTQLNTNALAGFDGFYYSMTAKDGVLYTTNAGDYTSEGELKVFNLNTNEFSYTKTTGIIPGSVVFQ